MGTTSIVKRDAKGRWEPGTPPPNPHGAPPQTTARLWRRLLMEAEREGMILPDGSEYTRSRALFDKAFARAMDEERKDSVLYMKLLLERAEGPAREDVANALGFVEIAARECERYLQRDASAPPPEPAPEAADE